MRWKGLDLRVCEGEVHGFLGPNGAGKSTTVRILLGLLRRNAGHITLLGADPWRDAVALHRRLSYVPGDVSLWPNLTGGEAIDVLGALRGGLDPARRESYVERFDLDTTKRFRTYSKGNRQKVAIVAALAADVELLIMDEPTSGLDPLMHTVFRESVADLQRQGRTVLLSSHTLTEVEQLCDRVTIIRGGRTVESGTLDELSHLTRPAIEVETSYPLTDLDTVDGVHDLDFDGVRAMFRVDSEHLPDIHRHLAAHEVTYLTSSPPSLEDVFLRHHHDVAAVST